MRLSDLMVMDFLDAKPVRIRKEFQNSTSQEPKINQKTF